MIRKRFSATAVILLLIGVIASNLLVEPSHAVPATIYVDDDNVMGPWDGTVEHPFENITSGLTYALEGDTVYVFNGTYSEIISTVYTVKNNLKLVGESRDGTVVLGEGGFAVYVKDAKDVNISNFTLVGISLIETSNGTVLRNNSIFNASPDGVEIVSSNYTLIDDNLILNSERYGIFVEMSNCTMIENSEVTGGNETGISLWNSHDLKITNSSIHDNEGSGIYGWYSYDIVLNRNDVANNDHGVWLIKSNNTILDENTIASNRFKGVFISNSTGNTIVNNTVTNNNDTGVYLEFCYDGGVINDNAIENSGNGIYIKRSNKIEITHNNVTRQEKNGITFEYSFENVVTNNKITNNSEYGVNLQYFSKSNSIWHNNFINNTVQAYCDASSSATWNKAYPSGGNYWSDHTEPDLKSGPGQNLPGSDGLVDFAYIITGGGHDQYPSKFPYEGHNVAIVSFAKYGGNAVAYSLPLQMRVSLENHGDYVESFNVTAYANDTVIAVLLNITLAVANSTTIIFIWNIPILMEYQNHTLRAVADSVAGEIDLFDNLVIYGVVRIVHEGDVNADEKVDIQDLARVSAAFGSVFNNNSDYLHLPWPCPTCPHTANADINSDGKVDIEDVARTSANFGWHR